MVALLSIGTELTTGQILNKNAQWLSIELLKLGMGVSCQITVPDDVRMINEALAFLEKQAAFETQSAPENITAAAAAPASSPTPGIVLITGGLGPTADDFTRNVLADTYAAPLEWNEENWQKVQAKLNGRGVQIRSVHRQQCEYPRGAEILPNSVGIADGFLLKTKLLEIYALPGPPKELADLWENQVRPLLQERIPLPLRWTQSIWTTSGLPESEVATRVNEALGEAGAQVLYRVHSPCVDVKLLFQQKDAPTYQELGEKIARALAPWLIPKTETQ